MKPRMTLPNLQDERDGRLTQSMKTQLRLKKTRKLAHIDPKAKTRTLPRRMRNKTNTRQRKGTNLIAAVRAERRVRGQKAERGRTSTKVMTKEVALRAKTEVLLRKKRSQNPIIVEIERRVMRWIKRIKKTSKEEMGKELEQSQKARKDQ